MIGQVLDASAVDAVVGQSVEATSWLIGSRSLSTPLYVPALAMGEVQAVRPHRLGELYELLEHPSVLRRDLDPATAERVAQLFDDLRVFDACAGHVVTVARDRGWPVITSDPERLRRIDPDIEVILV